MIQKLYFLRRNSMDEDYDIDGHDEDLDDFEPEYDLNSEDDVISDDEVELAGSLDGEFDAEYDAPMYGGYGSSIDFDELADEQKDLYDNAYHAGHDSK